QSLAFLTDEYRLVSDSYLESMGQALLVRAYDASAAIVACSSSVLRHSDQSSAGLQYEFDILRDPIRALAYPGQDAAAAVDLQAAQGLVESAVEALVFNQLAPTSGVQTSSSLGTINAALDAGASMVSFDASNIDQLLVLGLGPEANARITQAVESGQT